MSTIPLINTPLIQSTQVYCTDNINTFDINSIADGDTVISTNTNEMYIKTNSKFVKIQSGVDMSYTANERYSLFEAITYEEAVANIEKIDINLLKQNQKVNLSEEEFNSLVVLKRITNDDDNKDSINFPTLRKMTMKTINKNDITVEPVKYSPMLSNLASTFKEAL